MTATVVPTPRKTARARSASEGRSHCPPPADQAAPNAQPAGGGDGRDANGRFTKGNAGGPGNPFARQTARLRSALIQRVTDEDMGVIADALILRARNGELAAIKLLFQYVIGKPTAAVNPDTVDIDEFNQIYVPQRQMLGDFQETMNTLPPKLLTELVRIFNGLCLEQLSKVMNQPREKLAETMQNLPSFFPWMARQAEPDPVKEIDDILFGDDPIPADDPDLAPEPAPAAPSTNGANGQESRHQPPSTNGSESPPRSNGHRHRGQPAKAAEMEERPPQTRRCPASHGRQAKRRPSTNGENRLQGPPPKANGPNGRYRQEAA